MVIKDLQSKQPITISLDHDSAVRRLPPMMANMLARRFNPDFKGAGSGGVPPEGQPEGPAAGARPNTDAGALPDSATPNAGYQGGARAGAPNPGGAPGGRPACARPDDEC